MNYHFQEQDTLRFYLNLIKDIPRLSREEEQRLLCQSQAGSRKARNRLTNALLKYVVARAKRYRCKNLTFMDIIAEGNLGVMRAIEVYDFSKGVRLTTYATYWIRHKILRAIVDKERLVRVPVYLTDIIQKYNKIKMKFPELDDAKIARKMKVSRNQVKKIRKSMITIFSLNELNRADDEDGGEKMDIFVDEASPDPRIAFEQKEDCELLLNILPAREKRIIKLRFGFTTKRGLTLQSVSRYFNISRERVRQIETQAITRMRKFYRKELRNAKSNSTPRSISVRRQREG